MVAEPRYAPVNDSSFMKKEQSNGNLCCIESAKENACQASGSLPWTPGDFEALSSGTEEVKERETWDTRDLRNQSYPTHVLLTLHTSLHHFITPTPVGTIQPIKSRRVYYPPSNKHFLSGEGGQIIYCLREIPNAIFQRVAARLFYARTMGRVKKLSIFLLLDRIR